MSKLVRARIKPVEMLPEWAKCCPEFIQACIDTPDFTADLSRRIRVDSAPCQWCFTPHLNLVGVWDIDSNAYEAVELLDLDEGPVEVV